MPEIRVRDLQTHAPAVVRSVKEKGVRYIVTVRGRPAAAIIPIEEGQPEPESEGLAWDELVSLGRQISQNWQSKQTNSETLYGMRR